MPNCWILPYFIFHNGSRKQLKFRKQQTFSVKDLVTHTVSVSTAWLCPSHESSCEQCAKEWMYLCWVKLYRQKGGLPGGAGWICLVDHSLWTPGLVWWIRHEIWKYITKHLFICAMNETIKVLWKNNRRCFI